MIDARAARNDPDGFRVALARKGAEEVFDEFLRRDQEWRDLLPQVDELRAKTKLKGKPTPEQLVELNRVKPELQALEEQLRVTEAARQAALDQVPNLPDPSAPDGWTDEDAVEIRVRGERHEFDFEPREHDAIAGALGWLDSERASRRKQVEYAA